MKYAILGGSFDPPHKGHLAVANAVFDHLKLDEVVFVPNNRNPLKGRAYANPQDRLEMVRRMVEDEADFTVSDIEITRPGRSFSVDTVEEFSLARPGDLWFILGTDAIKNFMSWKKPELLARIARIALVGRPGNEIDRVLYPLPPGIQERIDIVPMDPNRISSSLIREEIATNGTPELMLDPKVWDYINERGLYRKEAEER